MYERSYGSKYAEFFTGPDGQRVWRTAAEIAKAMRADIKAEVAAGNLPGKPVTYSVTCENYAGGRSIRIEVRDLPGAWVEADPSDDWRYQEGVKVLSKEAARVQGIVGKIHGAYNHNGSDSMTDYFDVNYYGEAQIESEWSAGYRLQEKAAKAAKKASAA